MSSPSARRAGFTLVELLVVIAVIAILATITFGLFKAANEGRNKSKSRGEMQAISMACQGYRKTYGDFPYCRSNTGLQPRQNLLDQLLGRELIRFRTPGESPDLLPFNSPSLPGGTNRQKRSFLSIDEITTNDDANINDPALCTHFIDAWGNPYDYRYRVIGSHKQWLSPNFLAVSCSSNFVEAANPSDPLNSDEYWDPAGSGGSTMERSGIVPSTYFDESGASGPFRADNIVNWVN